MGNVARFKSIEDKYAACLVVRLDENRVKIFYMQNKWTMFINKGFLENWILWWHWNSKYEMWVSATKLLLGYRLQSQTWSWTGFCFVSI